MKLKGYGLINGNTLTNRFRFLPGFSVPRPLLPQASWSLRAMLHHAKKDP